MHLKNDSKLFSGVFVFPIIIAAVIILGLIALQAYHWAFAASRMTLLPLVLLGDERPRPLVPYEFGWSLHPSVLIGTGILGALYFLGDRTAPPSLPAGPRRPERWRVACFCAGAAADPGGRSTVRMHDLSDYYLFSVHMVQHLVLTLVVPPLLIAGDAGVAAAPPGAPAPGACGWPGFSPTRWCAALLYSVTIAVWHLDAVLRPHDAKPRACTSPPT